MDVMTEAAAIERAGGSSRIYRSRRPIVRLSFAGSETDMAEAVKRLVAWLR